MRTLLAILLLLATTAGCGGPRACTLIGASEGVSVRFPESVRLRQGFVRLEVCDEAGCEEARQSTGRIRRGTPPARSWFADFAALGREFAPGTVTVHAEVSDRDGVLLARGSGEVELTPSHPNGKECDGDGFVSGTLVLDEADLVGTP